jgi:energy-coupling factor transport system ATP-binding protein
MKDTAAAIRMEDALHHPLLLVEGLQFSYPPIPPAGPVPVCDGLTLSVPRGGTTVLFGAADAGKSTLARIVTGLVPRFTGGVLRGNVAVDGAQTARRPPYELLELAGMVAQDSEEQLFTTRCDTEVAFALESLGMPRPRMAERVRESLEAMGLLRFAHRNPATLSGGEKKRLLLACLCAIRPKLWILDETLQELDAAWKVAALRVVRDRGEGTLLLDSRWSTLAAERGTGFALLSKGKVAATAGAGTEGPFQEALAAHGILTRRPGRREERRGAPFLALDGVSFQFPERSGFRLEIPSLQLRRGETCALLGSNGSGKSTLARLLCGLLAPQAGTISLPGAGSSRPAGAEDLNARVGYLFQNPDHQIFLPSVREELALGLRRHGKDHGEVDALVADAVRLFDLPDPLSPPALMSYGARRRLQAATYYLLRRDLLVLDEVDSGLSCREVEQLISTLEAGDPGIILITHDLALAKSVADRILLMADGRLAGDWRRDRFDAVDLPTGGEGGQ